MPCAADQAAIHRCAPLPRSPLSPLPKIHRLYQQHFITPTQVEGRQQAAQDADGSLKSLARGKAFHIAGVLVGCQQNSISQHLGAFITPTQVEGGQQAAQDADRRLKNLAIGEVCHHLGVNW